MARERSNQAELAAAISRTVSKASQSPDLLFSSQGLQGTASASTEEKITRPLKDELVEHPR